MKSIRQLKLEARNSAENHGHRMGRFVTYRWHTQGKTLSQSGPSAAESFCLDCGAYVRVDTHPAPNGIDISGTVYGQQCKPVAEASIKNEYVPIAGEIINVGDWSSSNICAELARVLRRLGHVNVHVYESEFNAAVAANELAYRTEVLTCMVRDVRELSPPNLEFGMTHFKEHDGIFWGWYERTTAQR